MDVVVEAHWLLSNDVTIVLMTSLAVSPRQVPHMDVVVGGHTHSFLFTETEARPRPPPTPEAVRGPYPTIVQNIGGHTPIYLLPFLAVASGPPFESCKLPSPLSFC